VRTLSYDQTVDTLTEQTIAGSVDADPLSEMRAGLARFWAGLEQAGRGQSEAWREQVETAVMQVATDILAHGYPEGHKRGNVKLRLRLYADRVEALLTDRGIPFEEPAAPPDLDRFEYSRRARGANRWRLVKRLAKPAPPAS
jgi:anti-sigma regulatory factor (Ser/Thr protein kinase)